MIFHYNEIELNFEDDYVSQGEKCIGQSFEEFMLFCIEYYLEKEDLKRSEKALEAVVYAGFLIATGFINGDSNLPENKDKEMITIYYNGLPLEFKKKNVALYENVVMSVLSQFASSYVDIYLPDKSLMSDKDAVKAAIVAGMNDELGLYGLEIVED